MNSKKKVLLTLILIISALTFVAIRMNRSQTTESNSGEMKAAAITHSMVPTLNQALIFFESTHNKVSEAFTLAKGSRTENWKQFSSTFVEDMTSVMQEIEKAHASLREHEPPQNIFEEAVLKAVKCRQGAYFYWREHNSVLANENHQLKVSKEVFEQALNDFSETMKSIQLSMKQDETGGKEE